MGVQPWSPALGIVNGSNIELYFKAAGVLRGHLEAEDVIIWENGSRWYRSGSKAEAKANAPKPATSESWNREETGQTWTESSYLYASPSPSPSPWSVLDVLDT